MAEKIWTGAISTDFGTAGNWSPSGVPVTGDVIIFQGTPTNSCTTGTTTGIAANRLVVMPSYTGQVGGSGSYLSIDVNNGTNPRLIIGGAAGAGIYIIGDVSSTTVESDATGVFLDGGTHTIMTILKGTVTLKSGLTPTVLYVGYKTTVASDVTLTIEASVTLANIFQFGGAVTCASAFTNLYQGAGTFTQTAAVNSSNIYQLGSGTFTPFTGGGWTHANIYSMGGTFDGEGTYSAATITNTTVLSPASSFKLDRAARTTLTNAVRLFSSQATLQAVGSVVVS